MENTENQNTENNKEEIILSPPQNQKSSIATYQLNVPPPYLIIAEATSCLIFLLALMYVIKTGWKQSQQK